MAERFVWPDFLNLGMAPRKNFSPNEVAPRAALMPATTIHDPFTRIPRAFTPLVMYAYLLPVQLLTQPQFQATQFTHLLPNPYGP